MSKRSFGSIEAREPYGRYRAYYRTYDDQGREARHMGPRLFSTKAAANAWLARELALLESGQWTPPAERAKAKQEAKTMHEVKLVTLAEFASEWIETRKTSSGSPLAASTKRHYAGAIRNARSAELVAKPINHITPEDIDQWWEDCQDTPTWRHKAYIFFRAVFATAVKQGLLVVSPCQVEYGSTRPGTRARRERDLQVNTISIEDVENLIKAYDYEPFRLAIALIAYCGLRVSEALALKRKDIIPDTRDGLPFWTIQVSRAVAPSDDQANRLLKIPKTLDSIRTVLAPPHIALMIEAHLDTHCGPSPDSLLFPSTNSAMDYATPAQLSGKPVLPGRRKDREATKLCKAREIIGKPHLTARLLRHWARMIWVRAGLGDVNAELMLGHSLKTVLGTYAHFDTVAAWEVAKQISRMAGWPGLEPVRQVEAGVDIPMKLLAAMTIEQLANALSVMSEEQLSQIVPQLPAEKLAAILAGPGQAGAK